MKIIGAIIGLVIMVAFCFMVWRLVSSFFDHEKTDIEDEGQSIKMKKAEPEKKDPKTHLED